jgi:hypothetical protein
VKKLSREAPTALVVLVLDDDGRKEEGQDAPGPVDVADIQVEDERVAGTDAGDRRTDECVGRQEAEERAKGDVGREEAIAAGAGGRWEVGGGRGGFGRVGHCMRERKRGSEVSRPTLVGRLTGCGRM